jgi:hypothetical protein
MVPVFPGPALFIVNGGSRNLASTSRLWNDGLAGTPSSSRCAARPAAAPKKTRINVDKVDPCYDCDRGLEDHPLGCGFETLTLPSHRIRGRASWNKTNFIALEV